MRKTKEQMSLSINEVLRKIHYGEITIGKGTNLITELSQEFADQEMEAFNRWVYKNGYTYYYSTDDDGTIEYFTSEDGFLQFTPQQLIQKYKDEQKA